MDQGRVWRVFCGGLEIVEMLLNPSDRRINVKLYSENDYIGSEVILTDITGKTIAIIPADIQKGNSSYTIPDLELNRGVYFVHLVNNGNIVVSEKIMMQ